MLTWNIRIRDEIAKVENKKEVEVFYFPKTLNFREIDGTINFIITAINYILKYGKRNTETNRYLRKIRGRLSKISCDNITYEETIDFGLYCDNMSKLLLQKINKERIRENEGFFGTLEDESEEPQIVVIRMKDLRGRELGVTPEYDNFIDYVEHFLMVQLDNMRLSKETRTPLLSEYNSHIEINIAVNYLITAVGYLCRCRGGFNEEGLFFSDKLEADKLIEMCDITIERIKYVKYRTNKRCI